MKTRAEFAKRRRDVLKKRPAGAKQVKEEQQISQRQTRWRDLVFARERADGSLSAAGARGVRPLLVDRLQLAAAGYELRPLSDDILAAVRVLRDFAPRHTACGFPLPALDKPGLSAYALTLAVGIGSRLEKLRERMLPVHRRTIRDLSKNLNLSVPRAIEDPIGYLVHLANYAPGVAVQKYPALVPYFGHFNRLARGAHVQLVDRAVGVQRYAPGELTEEEWLVWHIERGPGDLLTLSSTPAQWVEIQACVARYRKAVFEDTQEADAERPHPITIDPARSSASATYTGRRFYIVRVARERSRRSK